MEASARSYTAGDGGDELSRSPARVFCLVVGATLVLVGVLGFIADSAFETGILLTVAAFAAGLAPLRDRGPARSPRTA